MKVILLSLTFSYKIRYHEIAKTIKDLTENIPP